MTGHKVVGKLERIRLILLRRHNSCYHYHYSWPRTLLLKIRLSPFLAPFITHNSRVLKYIFRGKSRENFVQRHETKIYHNRNCFVIIINFTIEGKACTIDVVNARWSVSAS